MTNATQLKMLSVARPPLPLLAATSLSQPKTKRLRIAETEAVSVVKRVHISKDVLHLAVFLRFDLLFKIATIAQVFRVKNPALAKALERHAKQFPQGPLTEEQEAAGKTHKDRLYQLLNKEQLIFRLSRTTSLEVLRFPGAKHSAANVNRIVVFLRSATRSLKVIMYSFTRCRLAREIIAVSKRIRCVQVIVDFTQMNSNGSQIKEMVLGGVNVFVDTATSFMTHDKLAIVDDREILEGSVNWSEHAMKSSDEILITNDSRAVQPLVEDFDDAKKTARIISQEEVSKFALCTLCAEEQGERVHG
ncbi:hypothetical protein Gpo141_00014203 [Globisporangium polare]